MLSSTSNWNVLVKFHWLLKGGVLTQLNWHSFCLLVLGPVAVIPWFALGELRSLCALSPWLALGSGLGSWSESVLESDMALWSRSAKGRWQLWKADFFSHLPPVLGHVLLCTDYFIALLFFPLLYFHTLVMYSTAGGDWFSAFGSVDVSLYWYLEELSKCALEDSLNLFFFSRAQKLSPIKNAADRRKKLEL